MVIDTSVLVAILTGEPERRSFIEALEAADSAVMSVASFVEISILMEARHGADGLRQLDLFLERSAIELIPVDGEQGLWARRAFGQFGKGRHPAALNYGDCFVYALAKVRGEKLLFKGNDFSRTDLEAAVG